MLHAALYRVRQFLSALLARVSSDDVREAEAILPPGARVLFRQMTVADQRHSLAVMRTLRRAGHADPDLLCAALLHDAAKSAARITPVHKIIIVLSRRFVPRLLAWLTRGEPRGWRRPFVVHQQHPELGAQWAAQAGCSLRTASLIRRHQELARHTFPDEEDNLLIALQQADGIN